MRALVVGQAGRPALLLMSPWGGANDPDRYASGAEPDWYARHAEQQRRKRQERVLNAAALGYAFGQAIGTSAYVLQTRRVGTQALSAGAVLGVCMGIGFCLRSL